MPRQGQSVESCVIGEWHVKKGDHVKEGDLLFTYETDKATFDEAAKVEGDIIAIFFAENDDVPCLLNVCVIGEAGESWEAFIPEGATQDGAGQAAPAAGETPAAPAADEAVSAAASPAAAPAPVFSDVMPSAAAPGPLSPRARMLAERQHADLRFAQATGPNGRVIERDVRALIENGHVATSAAAGGYDGALVGSGLGGRVSTADLNAPSPAAAAGAALPAAESGAVLPDYRDEKLPRIRKVISKQMMKSLQEMAQLTLNTTFDATDVMQLRAKLKKAKAEGKDEKLGFRLLEKVPTFNDIVLYAVSRTVLDFPACNAHLLDETMRYFNTVNLGVAVDTPRGLMVPVVRGAERKKISELSAEVRDLAAACQEGSISPDKLQGSTFTVSNVGSMGIESFTPIINPPETCILGVGGLQDRVRVVDGEVKAYKVMGLSLTLDHRALDGADGARFLRALVQRLENFSLLLMEG